MAIGLALQGSLADFAAGFLMIVFRPVRVGDYIEGAGVADSSVNFVVRPWVKASDYWGVHMDVTEKIRFCSKLVGDIR